MFQTVRQVDDRSCFHIKIMKHEKDESFAQGTSVIVRNRVRQKYFCLNQSFGLCLAGSAPSLQHFFYTSLNKNQHISVTVHCTQIFLFNKSYANQTKKLLQEQEDLLCSYVHKGFAASFKMYSLNLPMIELFGEKKLQEFSKSISDTIRRCIDYF